MRDLVPVLGTEAIVRQEPYGASTVALSAYNLLALANRPMSVSEIAEELRKAQHPLASDDLFARAVAGLVERGFVHEGHGLVWSKDRRRRIVRRRNRTDVSVDAETGRVDGGWTGWLIDDPSDGPVLVEEAI